MRVNAHSIQYIKSILKYISIFHDNFHAASKGEVHFTYLPNVDVELIVSTTPVSLLNVATTFIVASVIASTAGFMVLEMAVFVPSVFDELVEEAAEENSFTAVASTVLSVFNSFSVVAAAFPPLSAVAAVFEEILVPSSLMILSSGSLCKVAAIILLAN
jgi:hypothetical protein